MQIRMNINDRARGQWRGILMALGLPEAVLQNRHGPCPICGGKDRFRWDNDEGRGTFYCNQCGAGSGMDLVMKFKGLSFPEAARAVEQVLGVVTTKDFTPKAVSDEDHFRRLDALFRKSRRIELGDDADRYLTARGISEPKAYPDDLRICDSCWYSEGRYYPAMIAIIRDANGKMVNLQRTFLSAGRKAPVETPRKFLTGSLPAGSAVRLGPTNCTLGIAEGVETALAAGHMYGMPVWAALNAGNLAKWIPPPSVEEVVIFGDNDESYTGHEAAYVLARRLKQAGLIVTVKIPLLVNTDFADEALVRNRSKLKAKSGC